MIKKLAEGGMAEVFLARDLTASPPRLCVIKRILPSFARNPDFTKMFADEGRIASLMTHPNVVRVFEQVRSPDGPLLVMEYLAGQDLLDVSRRARRQSHFLPWDFVVQVLLEAAAGVDYAHQLRGADGQPLQIVHRDLSPANLFVTWDGVVKVLDFGIAHAQHRVAKTQAGTVKGKAQYVAPEQISARPLDARVDQFALAVVLYELLAGRPMFDQDNELACLHAVLEGRRPRVDATRTDVPPLIDEVIARATRVDPAERFPSMSAFRDALLACLGQPLTREALGARLRELFAAEFESHAELMGRLATAGTDELRTLYEQARHPEHPEPSPDAHAGVSAQPPPRLPARRQALFGAGLVVSLGLVVGAIASTSRPPPAPAEGSLTLRSEPPGAAVVLDGQATTWSTPVVLDHLALGRHRLRLTHPERAPLEHEVTLTPDDRAPTLVLTLPLPVGALHLRVEPPTARVTLDGEPVTLLGGQSQLAGLAVGDHRVHAAAPGFAPRELEAKVAADEVVSVDVVLDAQADAPDAQ